MTLRDVLGEELFQQVSAKINDANAGESDKSKQVRFVDLSEGQYVARSKYTADTNRLNAQISDLQSGVSQRDADITALKTQLEAAQAETGRLNVLQTSTKTDLDALQAKYDSDSKAWQDKYNTDSKAWQEKYDTDSKAWQTKYDDGEKAWNDRFNQQAYEFAVKSKAGGLKFTSEAAKRDFIRAAIDKKLQMDGETLTGYDEFLEEYRTNDPGALVVETAEPEPARQPEPTIVMPSNPATPVHKMSLSEMMKAKNENPNMEIRFE